MLRNFLAGIAGVLVAALVVWLVEMLGHSIYPPPAIDFEDMDAIREYVAAAPVGALAFVIVAWAGGALAETVAACKISNTRPIVNALAVGGFVLFATIYNLVVIPHPAWVAVLGVIGIVAGTWLGFVFASAPSKANRA